MNAPVQTPTAASTPTRVRYGVLGFACVLSMITYLDRVCFGTVAGDVQREFGLSDDQKGYLFGAFTLAYAAFEVPSGWLGDVFGPRLTLIRIVLWWSFFTALTGFIYPTDVTVNFGFVTLNLAFLAMLTVRFMFGMGEAGAYPNIARAFHNWFPFNERGFAKGTVWMAGRFAGGITPLIVLMIITTTGEGESRVVHWRHSFWIFGALGVVWSILFFVWFRDTPDQHPSVNAAELALIHDGDAHAAPSDRRVPWRRIFTSANLWLLCGMYFCASYGWYFNITYLPDFLKDRFHVRPGDEKWTTQWWTYTFMAGGPLLFGSVACWCGGVATDWFIRRTGNRKWGRRLFGITGHGLCALGYLCALSLLLIAPVDAHHRYLLAWSFTLSISLAAFFNDMTMGAAWASCIDIGRRYSGIVAGCMNTIGNLGGFMANILTGQILHAFTHGIDKKQAPDQYLEASQPGWVINFIVFSAVYVLAVLLWLNFDATKPVARDAALGEAET